MRYKLLGMMLFAMVFSFSITANAQREPGDSIRDRPDRPEKAEKVDKPERAEKVDRPEKVDREPAGAKGRVVKEIIERVIDTAGRVLIVKEVVDVVKPDKPEPSPSPSPERKEPKEPTCRECR